MKNEERWLLNYNLLRNYILVHHFLPSKKKAENRSLLYWWKYNRKLIKSGKLDADRTKMLEELSLLRDL